MSNGVWVIENSIEIIVTGTGKVGFLLCLFPNTSFPHLTPSLTYIFLSAIQFKAYNLPRGTLDIATSITLYGRDILGKDEIYAYVYLNVETVKISPLCPKTEENLQCRY